MPRLTFAFALLLLLACGRSLPFDAPGWANGGNSGGGGTGAGRGGGGGGGGGHSGGGSGGGSAAGQGGSGGGTQPTSCSPSLCGSRQTLAGGELTSLETSVQATQVDTAYDSMGRPVVAYGFRNSDATGTELVVRRLEDGHWVRLGCSTGDPGFSTVQLATDEMGNLLVAWIEREAGPNGASQVAVAQWDGIQWQMLGAPFRFSSEQTIAKRVGLVLSRGEPYLAWDENDASGATLSNGKVFVAQWDGTQWLGLGDAVAADPNDALEELALAVDLDGQPVVLYSSADPDLLLHPQLRKWDGAAWQPIATPDTQPFVRAIGGFRIDAQGQYDLGFSDSAQSMGPRTPHVARFDGMQWNLIGDGFEPMQDIQLYDLALDATGAPIIAVTRKQSPTIATDASILHWDGSVWSTLIGFGDLPQVDSNIAIAGGPGTDLNIVYSILQAGGFTIHVWRPTASQCK